MCFGSRGSVSCSIIFRLVSLPCHSDHMHVSIVWILEPPSGYANMSMCVCVYEGVSERRRTCVCISSVFEKPLIWRPHGHRNGVGEGGLIFVFYFALIANINVAWAIPWLWPWPWKEIPWPWPSASGYDCDSQCGPSHDCLGVRLESWYRYYGSTQCYSVGYEYRYGNLGPRSFLARNFESTGSRSSQTRIYSVIAKLTVRLNTIQPGQQPPRCTVERSFCQWLSPLTRSQWLTEQNCWTVELYCALLVPQKQLKKLKKIVLPGWL